MVPFIRYDNWEEGNQDLRFGHFKLEMPLRHP